LEQLSENRPSNSSNTRCRVAELRALCRDTGRFSKITVDYKDTVSFDANFLKEINLSFVQYQQTSESKYSLNTFEVSTVNASDVICHVNLMYQLGAYTLLEEEKTVIHEAIQNTFQNRPVSRHNARSSATRQRVFEEFDGRFSDRLIQFDQCNF
jgi:hypothetical protein